MLTPELESRQLSILSMLYQFNVKSNVLGSFLSMDSLVCYVHSCRDIAIAALATSLRSTTTIQQLMVSNGACAKPSCALLTQVYNNRMVAVANNVQPGKAQSNVQQRKAEVALGT